MLSTSLLWSIRPTSVNEFAVDKPDVYTCTPILIFVLSGKHDTLKGANSLRVHMFLPPERKHLCVLTRRTDDRENR